MRIRTRLLPFLVMAVALIAFAACGGDDSQAERRTTANETATSTAQAQQSGGTPAGGSGSRSTAATQAPPDATRTVQVQCTTDLKAFRFNGQLSLKSAQGGGNTADLSSIVGSLLQDVKFSGAFVAPDRTQLKLDGGQSSALGTIEFVQIGNTSYTKLGSAGWQQSTGPGPADLTDQFDPREFCRQIEQGLSGNVPSRKEKVNGVDAIRYDYDRAALEKLGNNGFLGSVAGPNDQLPEKITMSIWVSEKEKFPVKMLVSASGKEDGQDYSVDMELNVTDLNGNVTINAPR
jgi:hypothetical protein